LQEYGETLMQGKVGSVVAIEPKTGEILSIISAPSYDPNTLSGSDYGKNLSALMVDSVRPLYNRPIQAMYAPGSIFKTVQTLIGMQEGILTPNTTYYCGDAPIGDHAPPGYYKLFEALKLSSNQYYYKAFRSILNQEVSPNTFTDSRIGLEKWAEYVSHFGLGEPLGIDIPNEKGGYIPTPAFYDRIYGEGRWKFSTIYSLSIGQGEMLVTPLQMANLAALIANKGYYYTPHLIKSMGMDNAKPQKYTTKNEVGIDSAHYSFVHEAMAAAVYGTAGRAVIQDIVICGKTGTAENFAVVKGKRVQLEDHSVFMAFAPKEDPKIAIAVYVENAGWGGRAAASTASLMIEKYLKGCVDRTLLEEFVLKGDFIY
jgi:penicillin-binding protein 2